MLKRATESSYTTWVSVPVLKQHSQHCPYHMLNLVAFIQAQHDMRFDTPPNVGNSVHVLWVIHELHSWSIVQRHMCELL